MLQVQHPILLTVLAAVPLVIILYGYARARRKSTIKKMGEAGLVALLLRRYNPKAAIQKFLLAVVALTALILALANVRKPTGAQNINRTGIDVMIALDVSKSMLAQDISPNRLERARQMLSRLIDNMGNNRVGIVIFAGKAYLQMPLTGDASAAKMYLSAASVESVPTQGTVIGDALKMCFASFDTKEKKYKAVVLVSDGEDHDATANELASQMSKEGVVIYTVGIGSPSGAPLMDPATGEMKKDAQGNNVISKLNEDALKEIARNGNGAYMHYNNSDAVAAAIAKQLAGMDKRAVKDESLMNYQSFYQWLLGLALLLLIAELFINEVKTQKMKTTLKAGMSLMLCMLSLTTWAQADKKEIKKGNTAYAKKEYAAATGDYENALKKNPDNAAAQYNLGNAQYKNNKKEEAIAAYDKSISKLHTHTEKSNAYYNKGVVLHNDNKLPECIAAYKQALILDPANDDARQNLQKALKKQQEQQKKDQKDQEKQPQKQKNQDQKPKPQPSKLNKKEAEEKLKALMQKEKNLQDKLHKANSNAPNKPEKDW